MNSSNHQIHVNQNKKLDISNCADEPIHIPGSIQPHGVLLALSLPHFRILHASQNTQQIFEKPAEALLGTDFPQYLSMSDFAETLQMLLSQKVSDFNPINIRIKKQDSEFLYNGIAHLMRNLLILELEPASQLEHMIFTSSYQKINSTIAQIEKSTELLSLCEATASNVKCLTQFDRVMIYQFDAHWNGKVIAEAKESEQESFLDLHYPASDIPDQARKLYEQNSIRIIPDVSYCAARIVSLESETHSLPLDLSHSVLRSVSPMHIQYLQNMGVGASMSISIMRGGVLWGLIACHHRGPKYLPYEIRKALEHIGKFFSLQLAVTEKHENLEYKAHLKNLHVQLYQSMKQQKNFIAGLTQQTPSLTELVSAHGAAIYFRKQLTLLGKTPTSQQVRELIAWIQEKLANQVIYSTSSLSESYPKAQEIKDVASGLLCISIPEPEPSYVLWFRPEVIQTVNWAGNPEKAVEHTHAGTRLGPRRSFALWKQTVQFNSEPWKLEELDISQDLRRSIIEVDLERQVIAEREARAEAELSNRDLDDFAYIVSHDLKEPLRSIRLFVDFIKENEKDKLSPESLGHLNEIIQLTSKTRNLISVLHEFSKLGHVELSITEVNLDKVVHSVLERLAPTIKQTQTQISIPSPLPSICCDQARVSEIFSNLITNAIRHNPKANKRVEIGFDSTKSPLWFYVKDNGLGLAIKPKIKLFQIFQRSQIPPGAPIPGEKEKEIGSGSGLAIVKRIVDRHEGKIWVESQPTHGSTFYFTLAPETKGKSSHQAQNDPSSPLPWIDHR